MQLHDEGAPVGDAGPERSERAPRDFAAFFESDLRGLLQRFEDERKRLASRVIYTVLGAIGAGGLGALIASASGGGRLALAVAIGLFLVVLVIGLLLQRPAQREYTKRFKREVVAQVVTFVDPALRYVPEAGIDIGTFRAAGIYRDGIDRYRCEDMVSGKLGATELTFSEVHAEYKTTSRDSKGRSETKWHTIFRGFFCRADFNKHFHGSTWVLTDTAERLFGALGRALQGITFGQRELVKLEDPEFEREFVVYSTDQQEARYILSPALMARMLAYRRTARSEVQFSFVGGSVFVAVPNSDDLFEPRLFRTNVDPKLFQTFHSALLLVVSLVEQLNLNTRIWTRT